MSHKNLPTANKGHVCRQAGFAHLILLLGVFVIGIAALLYFVVFKKDVSDLTNIYNKPTPSITEVPKSLEEEVNEIPDDDPTTDFNEVDADISNL